MPARVRIPSPAHSINIKMRKHKQLEELVRKLKKAAIENNAPVWRKIARELEKPTRLRREVNIFKIDRYGREGEIIVVPGKVLGVGELSKKLTVAAYRFSEKARKKILSNGKIVEIEELLKKNPKGTNIRIIA